MDISGVFVLANDVAFIPADTLSAIERNGFETEPGDIIISQLNSRTASKVISGDLALLLQEFRSPKPLAEGIYTFSVSQQKDPQLVADEVFGSLENLYHWGFLIGGHERKPTLQQGFPVSGEKFRSYTLLEMRRQYEDSAVFRVKDNSNNIFALKLFRAGANSHAHELFNNEAAILSLLDGVINPGMIEQGKENDILYLVTEWCEGITSEQEAIKYRNINNRENFVKLLDLSVLILEAYHHLHRQKILHGDIHPDNILVTPSGQVRIIDYGYAGGARITETIQRGGTGFYYEPEFAAAALQDITRPPVTEKAEQYSIAVLLYYLISGHHYLNFSFEKEKLFNQIAHDTPLLFGNFDLQVPDELGRAFSTALAKVPENRFSSLKEFAGILRKIRNDVYESHLFYTYNKQNTEEGLLTFILEKFGWDSPFIEKGLSLQPTCSVNYGAAGIAYLFHRASCMRQDAGLADIADIWADKASLFSDHYEQGFYSPAMDITGKVVGKTSLYHSPTGVHLTQALISNSRGDLQALSKAVQEFLSAAAEPCNQIDLTLGKAGILIGSSLLYRELIALKGFPVSGIISLAEGIKNEIWNEIDGYSPMGDRNPLDHFGIAHGWAGLLYATLFWCHEADCKLPDNFLKRVDELLHNSISNEKYIRWPLTTRDKNSWPGWCNGNAGHIFLWLLLYKYFRDEKFIAVAERLAGHLITGMNTRNPDLCCGKAGQAYAMIGLYKATLAKKYLEESKRIKLEILNTWGSQPIRNNSLYKGEVGIGVLLAEMNDPTMARMPLFE